MPRPEEWTSLEWKKDFHDGAGGGGPGAGSGSGGPTWLRKLGRFCWSSEYFGTGAGAAVGGYWNCCKVAERWWLVAGLRRVGICDLEFRLERVPGLLSWAAVVRLTSLLRGCCGGTAEGDSMGAAEPCEKVTDGESRATLDRGLPCCDSGRMDRRRIHEPLDESESRETSDMGGAQSAWRMKEWRLDAFGGVTAERGSWRVETGHGGARRPAGEVVLVSGGKGRGGRGGRGWRCRCRRAAPACRPCCCCCCWTAAGARPGRLAGRRRGRRWRRATPVPAPTSCECGTGSALLVALGPAC